MRKKGELEAEILALTERGPMPASVMAKRLNARLNSCTATVSRMVSNGKLEVHGPAKRFGWDVRNMRVLAYGHPREADEDEVVVLQRVRQGRRPGSGVIAPQPYATGYRWGNV
jgi:hypothetical protein